MKMLILTLFLINIYSQQDTKVITCGFNECLPNTTAYTTYLEQSDRTVLDLGDGNASDVDVVLPENADPRNLVLTLNNNTDYIHNINVDFKSKKPEKNASNFILIGDLFNEININLDGYDGQSGEDASVICARRFMNGIYGNSARDFFVNRRDNDQQLTLDRCDDQDVAFLHNSKFSCKENNFENVLFPRVNVERVRYQQKCLGTTVRYKCLQRTVQFRCEWAARGRGYGIVNKFTNLPCPDQWRSSGDCAYNYSYSCWHSILDGSAYPASDEIPAWTLEKQIGRCNNRTVGGMFAYQFTREYPELLYREINNLNNICSNFFPNPASDSRIWYWNSATNPQVTSPGLDPDTLEPIIIPGLPDQSSTWTTKTTDFFEPCSGYFEEIQTKIESWSTFGEIGRNCSDARISEDPNNRIPWIVAGREQREEFGTETLLCEPNECPVRINSKDEDFFFDTIDPTIGANATSQGKGLVFIFRAEKINLSASTGKPGVGGKNDLTELNEPKYCVKIDDANTRGLDSDFALNPLVTYNIYNWKGLNINSGQPGGSIGNSNSNSIKLFKGVNAFSRYLIQQEITID